MTLAHIELENLSISPLNMRHAKKDPDTSDILPSVRRRGILMPLLVRPNGSPSTFEIVAGRRRYFAARTVKEEQGSFPPVPCHIMGEGDDADALEASLIENIARKNPDEMTQYEVFTRLVVKEGRSVEQIAATFGLSERQVHQRLALGNLLPKIREAYRAEDIDADTIRHLTMATKRQQKEWLDLYLSEPGQAPQGYQLKRWLFGGVSIDTSVALFPLEALGEDIVTDLFGTESYFRDQDKFWARQNEAIASRRDAYLAAGWADVVILDTGNLFEAWAHEKIAKKNGGKVFIAISARGEVTFHEGYLDRKDARRKKRDDGARTQTKTADSAPELTSGLQTYIDFHRLVAVRSALMDKPGVALKLIAAHIICGSRLWRVSPEPLRAGRNDTDASVTASAAQTAFLERRADVLSRLGLPEGAALVSSCAEEPHVIFARLLELPDADVKRILALLMAESLEAGSGLVEAVGANLGVTLADTWMADDCFFDLVRDKGVINKMVADLAGKPVANANVTATGKAQKQIVRDCLAGTNGRSKASKWLPRWLEFPARGYRKDGGFRTAEVWASIKRHFPT